MTPIVNIVGLGPGKPELLTMEARMLLESAREVWVRTARHPTVEALPEIPWRPFDTLYESEEEFAAVYRAIVHEVLRHADETGSVVYAVPGSPHAGEATVEQILREARERGWDTRVVEGLSFLEPTLGALALDALEGVYVADALGLAARHHPPFPPSAHVLVAQLYSPRLAGDVKLVLMNQYPDEYPVRLVHGAGTASAQVEDLLLYEIDRSKAVAHLTTLYLPPLPTGALEELQETLARLRAPDGCPWDREQTHLTIRGNLLEETYEALEALDREDPDMLAEELGDLLLQIGLHTQIATEAGEFRMADVIGGVDRKIHRRHPHVFGQEKVDGVSQVLQNWEKIKETERGEQGGKPEGLFDSVPTALPALEQAKVLQQRAARVGFDWPDISGVKEKVGEEMTELEQAATEEERNEEFGDLLFAMVNFARWLKVDPESALRSANAKFRKRFAYVETAARLQSKSVKEMTLAEMDVLWNEAKRHPE
jgi:tetrapyrrole methylase family protein/MazG family protein